MIILVTPSGMHKGDVTEIHVLDAAVKNNFAIILNQPLVPLNIV